MKCLIFLISISMMVSGLLYQAWAEDVHMHQEEGYVSGITEEQIEDVGNTFCPVMGHPVDDEVSHVHEGKKYYFCCANCVEDFKEDPQKYIEKLIEKL